MSEPIGPWFRGRVVMLPGPKTCSVCTNRIKPGASAVERLNNGRIEWACLGCGAPIKRRKR
jgi:RNase P subunit RPR2